MRIRVFHALPAARSPSARASGPSAVVEVFAYDDPEPGDARDALDRAFRLLNVGHDPDFGTPDERAVRYRRRRNRSLCVGDVVAVDDTHFVCKAAGFEETRQRVAIELALFGTTPIRWSPRSGDAVRLTRHWPAAVLDAGDVGVIDLREGDADHADIHFPAAGGPVLATGVDLAELAATNDVIEHAGAPACGGETDAATACVWEWAPA
jgi:hypothetical protein